MRTLRTLTARIPSKAPAAAVALLLGVAVTGCSFSWDESGIKDVLFGGRNATEIVQTEPPKPTSAEAAAAQAAADEADGKRSLTRLAILPVAYSDAAGSGIACDLCPAGAQMKPTDALSARLATGFIYEAIARHPRVLFPTPAMVEKAMAATGRSMRASAAALAAEGRADVVVAAALIELRERVGSDQSPEKTAGVALYVSLVDARTGEVRWSDTFDEDESGRGPVKRTYDKIINDRPVRFRTAQGFSEHAVDELIEDLVDELD